jgi:hypothetical protein
VIGFGIALQNIPDHFADLVISGLKRAVNFMTQFG